MRGKDHETNRAALVVALGAIKDLPKEAQVKIIGALCISLCVCTDVFELLDAAAVAFLRGASPRKEPS